jgi:glutamyl-tRNA synthetase
MRVRFAPSPTGFLHIGNARTAVANFIIATKEKAEYILRIEDTDIERSSKESEDSILSDLKWLGIKWTEGPDCGGDFGPYRQSERYDIYQEYTDKLMSIGSAYHCYCSKEELDDIRKDDEAQKKVFVYQGKCRNLSADDKKKFESKGRKPTVRFRVPDNESIKVNDLIKGEIVFNSENIGGDFIIVRSDGHPIYNYIVIIDDMLMNITHVIRGEDHLSNTPKQICIAKALNLPSPQYAHLPLILGSDRSKLSKRHGITSVELYRKEGYLPESLMNYLSTLGWASDTGEEILSIDQISSQFELSSLGKSAAVFDFQKLKWMNAIYIRSYPLDKLTDLMIPYIKETGINTDKVERNILETAVNILKGNCEILSDIKKIIGMLLLDINEQDEDCDKLLREEDSVKLIKAASEIFDSVPEENFTASLLNSIKEKSGFKGKKLFHPVRAMLTGRLNGPELDIAIPVIGREKCRKRIDFCLKKYAG